MHLLCSSHKCMCPAGLCHFCCSFCRRSSAQPPHSNRLLARERRTMLPSPVALQSTSAPAFSSYSRATRQSSVRQIAAAVGIAVALRGWSKSTNFPSACLHSRMQLNHDPSQTAVGPSALTLILSPAQLGCMARTVTGADGGAKDAAALWPGAEDVWCRQWTASQCVPSAMHCSSLPC